MLSHVLFNLETRSSGNSNRCFSARPEKQIRQGEYLSEAAMLLMFGLWLTNPTSHSLGSAVADVQREVSFLDLSYGHCLFLVDLHEQGYKYSSLNGSIASSVHGRMSVGKQQFLGSRRENSTNALPIQKLANLMDHLETYAADTEKLILRTKLWCSHAPLEMLTCST